MSAPGAAPGEASAPWSWHHEAGPLRLGRALATEVRHGDLFLGAHVGDQHDHINPLLAA